MARKTTPTGRVYKPQPESQNLPGTPAAKLEMVYATYGRGKSHGKTFAEVSKAFHDALVNGYGFKPVSFPCQILFTIYPYEGEPRTAVYNCPNQQDVDEHVEFYMSDTTGNTKNVVYSVYVKPEVRP
jgi:hypothetical protein